MSVKKYKVTPSRSTLATRAPWGFLAAFIVLAGLIILLLEITNTTHIFHKAVPATQVIVKVGKPVAVPKNNVSASNNSSTAKTPTGDSSHVISSGTDTNGNASSSTNPNQWVVAQSGNITVKQPIANAKLQSGSILSGSAKVDQVSFRLIDSKQGVISEGTLNVVNGNFSGALSFVSHSSSGRLDVFSTNAQGVELNEVQIAVGF